jgi:hypothetical protein
MSLFNIYLVICLSFSFSLSLSLSPPFDVRVETLVDPILIDNLHPRFSWHCNSSQEQLGYQLFVFEKNYTLDQNQILVWNSGKVITNRSYEIVYTGKTLTSDTDYFILVSALYKDNGKETWINATKYGSFNIGLLTTSDWDGAEWIGGKNQLRSNEFLLPTTDSIQRARIYITGVGFYELWVNGQRVIKDSQGRDTFINPGFSTIYSKRILYNAYDITSLLTSSDKNVIGIRLGMGKYGYLGEFCINGTDACNSAIIRVTILQSSFNKSKTALISSSTSGWLTTTSSILFDHLYNGEIVDGRIEYQQNGWSTSTFQPGNEWIPVSSHISPTSILSAHTMPQITSWESNPLIPINVTEVFASSTASAASSSQSSTTGLLASSTSSTSSFVFDLGINVVGLCSIILPKTIPSGINITLVFAETLLSNGNVHVQFHCPSSCCADGGNCANQTFTYITNGNGNELYRPTFAYSGFRWVQVFGWPSSPIPAPTINSLSCISTSTGVETTGSVSFNTSTPQGIILNGIQSLVIRSQRANLHSHPTDCPQREKRGWMADSSVSADEASLNLNMQLVYENWIRTHADTAETGCGPLPINSTCPKWQNNQPEVSLNPYEVFEVTSSTSTSQLPNCYICCYGRSGFGCTKETPINTTGSIADVIPFDKNGYGSFPGSISWMSANFIVMSVLKDKYNALQSLESVYSALKAHLLFYNWNSWQYNNNTGLVYWDQYGDWNSLIPTNGLLIANFYYLFDSLELSDLAAQLNNPEDSLAFLGLAAYLNAELPLAYATFPSGKNGYWDKGSQAAQAVGLFLGIGGDLFTNLTKGSIDQLVSDVTSRDFHYTVGTIGSRFLLQALSLSGKGDIALSLASQTSYPSIGAMFTGTEKQPPLGTLWESWVGPAVDGSSGNHIMLGGGIGEWFYTYALGLRFSFHRPVAPLYTETERSCARIVSFGIDLRTSRGISGKEMCIIATVLQKIQKERVIGKAVGSLVEYSNLLQLIKEEIALVGLPSTLQQTTSIPIARLVIDSKIANVLKSANGSITTPLGLLSTSWQFFQQGQIDILFNLPSSILADIFIPLELLEISSRHTIIIINNDKTIQWSAILECNILSNANANQACFMTNISNNGNGWNTYSFVGRNVPNDRVENEQIELESWKEQFLNLKLEKGGLWKVNIKVIKD